MVTININKKRYEIPERLTVEQYHKALQYDWEDPKYYPLVVSQLIGAPAHLLQRADDEALQLAIAFIVKSMNDRRECETIDLDQITFGQFVDLDCYLGRGLDKHFLDIIELIAPKAKWADEAMWAIDRFAQFRTFTYRQYKVLFGLTDREIDREQREEEAQPDVARAWYRVIVGLAGDNLLNIDEVTEQPLKKVLNFMALQKEKQLEENQRQLKQKRQYDLQRAR